MDNFLIIAIVILIIILYHNCDDFDILERASNKDKNDKNHKTSKTDKKTINAADDLIKNFINNSTGLIELEKNFISSLKNRNLACYFWPADDEQKAEVIKIQLKCQKIYGSMVEQKKLLSDPSNHKDILKKAEKHLDNIENMIKQIRKQCKKLII